MIEQVMFQMYKPKWQGWDDEALRGRGDGHDGVGAAHGVEEESGGGGRAADFVGGITASVVCA